jgi:GNAT superfamily N-acetyltransferase
MIHYQTQPASDALERLGVAEGLGKDFDYQADAVRSTLIGMMQMAGAQLTIAFAEDRVVGFLLLSEPHPQSSWSRAALKGCFEVAALEVARAWRGRGIGTGLLKTALTTEWDERILLGSFDPEEWDTLGMGLSKGAYKQMLLTVFRKVGFAEYPRLLDAGLSHDPSSCFLVRVGASVDRARLLQFQAAVAPAESQSLLRINQLSREEREAIYRRLIPEAIFTTFNIDRTTLTDPAGNHLVEFESPPEEGLVRIGVRKRPQDPDWCYLLKLQTTLYNEVELAFIIISDPRSERFNIDRDPAGRDTRLGTTSRNVTEEIRAMQAGLAPGQTQRGLGLLKETVRLVEEFVRSIGHDLFVLEALFYNNAILYERYGFGYTVGLEDMETIHREFQPGGELYARLDGSTPFRQGGAEQTVRGRSWAIHDGILERPWRPPRMYKRVGKDKGVCTFPGGLW